MPIRFRAYQYQNFPLRELEGRWRRAEEPGFEGRDPTAIRHSLCVFPPLTPWESAGYLRDMVGRFAGTGIDEFVLYWPGTWRDERREDRVFERVYGDVIPGLRETTR